MGRNADYSKNVAQSIIGYFKENDLKYDFDIEKGIITTGMPSRCKLNGLKVRILIHRDGYTSYAYSPIDAEKKVLAKAAEYITRANYGLRYGNFEMDFSDGEIRYKLSNRSGDVALTEQQIEDSFLVAMAMFQRYGDNMLAVLFGLKEPAEAVQEAEDDD